MFGIVIRIEKSILFLPLDMLINQRGLHDKNRYSETPNLNESNERSINIFLVGLAFSTIKNP